MVKEKKKARRRELKAVRRTMSVVLRTARDRLGFSQEGMAVHVGVSAKFYARIERAESLPSVATLFLMVKNLGVSADELLGLSKTDLAPDEDQSPEPPTVVEVKEGSAKIDEIFARLEDAEPSVMRMVGHVADVFEQRLRMVEKSRKLAKTDPADD